MDTVVSIQTPLKLIFEIIPEISHEVILNQI